MRLQDKTVLITGATGFLGGRLAERLLLEEKARVRALVRNSATAVWLSRMAVEIVPGDVTVGESLGPALRECEVVFHCAALLGGDSEQMQEVNVRGTENLLAAACEARVSRFVHVSSLAVHGLDLADGADETTPLRPGDDPYARTKMAADQLVLDYQEQHGLPVVIVRPTIMYGPRSQWWTIDPIRRIQRNQLAQLGRGRGIANVVYVDDVVSALLLAAVVPGIEGEVFLISGEERVAWGEFFGAYAAMVGRTLPIWPRLPARLISASTEGLDRTIDWVQDGRPQLEGVRLGAMVGLRGMRKVLTPLYKLRQWEVAAYGPGAQVSTAKACRRLGYRSEWPLAKAMAETETWLRVQGYLPPDSATRHQVSKS
jgi:nucleoside-diphosphate-sugar epimerase